MKVGIISLGLIGSSLLKALSNHEFDLVCITRNPDSIEKAKKYNAQSSNDITTIKDCEIVFVCSPISATLEMLDKLENIVDKTCVVLDTASVKEFVMQKKRPYKFIGSHPMAGTAQSGFDAGFKELFEGAKWVICPSDNVTDEDIEKAKTVIKQTGATVLIADPKEHDFAVALISHAPMYISQAIFATIEDNELAKKLASSGFRDMTRLAMSNTQMAEDMLNYNDENISKALGEFGKAMVYLQNNYREKIEQISKEREKMYSPDGKNVL